MLDKVKSMITEGIQRYRKPSQIQKYVFRNYGYVVSKEAISEVLLEQSGINKSKLSLWTRYRLAQIQASKVVNVVELDLSDEDYEEAAIDSNTIFVSVGDTTVEFNPKSLPAEMLAVLQSAGLEL